MLRALLALPTEKEMINTLDEILSDNLSVRAVENKRKRKSTKIQFTCCFN